MKRSIKIITIGFIFFCIFPIIKIVHLRNQIDKEGWEKSEEILTAHNQFSETDSISTEAPSAMFKWYDITMGIDSKINEGSRKKFNHIFGDYGFKFYRVYQPTLMQYINDKASVSVAAVVWDRLLPQEVGPKEIKKFSAKHTVGSLGFIFLSDTTLIAEGRTDLYISLSIRINKVSYLPESNKKKTKFATSKDIKYHSRYVQNNNTGTYFDYVYQIIKYKTWTVTCGWHKGLWITTISIHGNFPESDLREMFKLRDRIRDRIFEYYRELNRKYSDSS